MNHAKAYAGNSETELTSQTSGVSSYLASVAR
jgi:hypothetical protein